MIIRASSCSFDLNDFHRKTGRKIEWLRLQKFSADCYVTSFENFKQKCISSSLVLRGRDKWIEYCHSAKKSSKRKVFAVKTIHHVERAYRKSWVLRQKQFFSSAENGRKKSILHLAWRLKFLSSANKIQKQLVIWLHVGVVIVQLYYTLLVEIYGIQLWRVFLVPPVVFTKRYNPICAQAIRKWVYIIFKTTIIQCNAISSHQLNANFYWPLLYCQRRKICSRLKKYSPWDYVIFNRTGTYLRTTGWKQSECFVQPCRLMFARSASVEVTV